MHGLVIGAPSIRRKFIDWGAFHVELQFHANWKRYQYALKQRNNLLKSSYSETELNAWTLELSETGQVLDHFRREYLNKLKSVYEKWVNIFSVGKDIDYKYKPGWDSKESLKVALDHARPNCIKYKTTSIGPHRADLSLQYLGHPAKQVVSRGEQKLIVYALVFSQLELLRDMTGNTAILLCDDPEAELDASHREILIDSIRHLGVQCFITGIQKNLWNLTENDRMFHVEQGHIQQDVER